MFHAPPDVHLRTARMRRLMADTVASLPADDLRTPSLCVGWDVHTVAAHLTMHWNVSFWQFALKGIRYRDNTDRIVDACTRRLASRPTSEVVDDLRRHADHASTPPMIGPMGPLADVCIHLRDVARPLGLQVDADADDWRLILDYLTAPSVEGSRTSFLPDGRLDGLAGSRTSFLPDGRLDGLALRATDQDWATGDGAEVSGTAEALVMAMTGRTPALDELQGAGAGLLQARVTGRGYPG